MPDLDLEPHEYRRKGDWIVRHLNVDTFKWWATFAGIGCVVILCLIGALFPSTPWWLAWGIGLAPGVVIIVAYEMLEGTRVTLSTGTKSPVPAPTQRPPLSDRASPRGGTAAGSSRAPLPKARPGRPSSQ